jgi:hypothetical protein
MCVICAKGLRHRLGACAGDAWIASIQKTTTEQGKHPIVTRCCSRSPEIGDGNLDRRAAFLLTTRHRRYSIRQGPATWS